MPARLPPPQLGEHNDRLAEIVAEAPQRHASAIGSCSA
jgi:hypothetical protein